MVDDHYVRFGLSKVQPQQKSNIEKGEEAPNHPKLHIHAIQIPFFPPCSWKSKQIEKKMERCKGGLKANTLCPLDTIVAKKMKFEEIRRCREGELIVKKAQT